MYWIFSFLLLTNILTAQDESFVDWEHLASCVEGQSVTIRGFTALNGRDEYILTDRLDIPSCCVHKQGIRNEIVLIDPPPLDLGHVVTLKGTLHVGKGFFLDKPIYFDRPVSFKMYYALMALVPLSLGMFLWKKRCYQQSAL